MFNSVFRHASLYIIGLIVCFLFLMVSSAPVSAIHWQDSVEEARKKQAETARPVMLYFYTDWSRWCDRLKNYTLEDEQVEALSRKFYCAKIDLGQGKPSTNKSLIEHYKVVDLPTIVFIGWNDSVIKRQSGYLPPDQLARDMDDALKDEKDFQRTLVILRKQRHNVELNRKAALAYLKREQLEKAFPYSSKVPDDLEISSYIALAYLERAELGKALLFAEKVLEKDSENSTRLLPKLHLELGAAYAHQACADQLEWEPENRVDLLENYQKAAEHLKTVINLYPKSDVYELAHLYLAVAHASQWEFKKSIDILERLAKQTTNEKMKFQTQMMLKRVKHLERFYKTTSIINTNYVLGAVKDLANVIKNDK